MVSYSGKQRHQLLSKMRNQLKITLPDDIKTTISHKSMKVSTKFPANDKIDFQHKQNVVCHGKCSSEESKDDHVGETKRRIVETIKDQNSKGNTSHSLKHGLEYGHTRDWEKDFQTLDNNHQSNFKREISKSLFMRQLKPSLNLIFLIVSLRN